MSRVLCWMGFHGASRYVSIRDGDTEKRLGCGFVCRRCGKLEFHVMYRTEAARD